MSEMMVENEKPKLCGNAGGERAGAVLVARFTLPFPLSPDCVYLLAGALCGDAAWQGNFLYTVHA